ncbi:hypothetical protein HPTD01_2720 [Halomonas sp. TD01]|nr:hypothetical protein HPTD01_2720 [Halomonas sp. TD01]
MLTRSFAVLSLHSLNPRSCHFPVSITFSRLGVAEFAEAGSGERLLATLSS